jgi:hypothetical protein
LPEGRLRIRRHIAPLLAAAGTGALFAITAIISQEGYARGYTSFLLLFVSLALGCFGLVAALIAAFMERAGSAFEFIASAIILPATFILIVLIVKTINGE